MSKLYSGAEIVFNCLEDHDAIKRTGADDDTLVIFTSDNGPRLSYGDHAGSSGAYREGKGTMFEGGIREPTLMRWPGRIPAGTCSEFASTIDIVPTFAKLIDAQLPEHKVDGHDIADHEAIEARYQSWMRMRTA